MTATRQADDASYQAEFSEGAERRVALSVVRAIDKQAPA